MQKIIGSIPIAPTNFNNIRIMILSETLFRIRDAEHGDLLKIPYFNDLEKKFIAKTIKRKENRGFAVNPTLNDDTVLSVVELKQLRSPKIFIL